MKSNFSNHARKTNGNDTKFEADSWRAGLASGSFLRLIIKAQQLIFFQPPAAKDKNNAGTW
jgi:hypothetical protein